MSCSSSSYYFHRVVAIIVVIGFAFGAPVAIAIAMTRGADAASTAGQDRQHIVHSVSEELEISDDDARNAVNDIIGARKYSFLTAGEQCTACAVDWILHALMPPFVIVQASGRTTSGGESSCLPDQLRAMRCASNSSCCAAMHVTS